MSAAQTRARRRARATKRAYKADPVVEVSCPSCYAIAGQPCRSSKGFVRDFHTSRIYKLIDAINEAEKAQQKLLVGVGVCAL